MPNWYLAQYKPIILLHKIGYVYYFDKGVQQLDTLSFFLSPGMYFSLQKNRTKRVKTLNFQLEAYLDRQIFFITAGSFLITSLISICVQASSRSSRAVEDSCDKSHVRRKTCIFIAFNFLSNIS